MRAARGDEVRMDRGRDVPKPTPADGEVLVRVHASSLNAVDWYGCSGRPYVGRLLMGMREPKSSELGGDFAGVVEAVGDGVDGLRARRRGVWLRRRRVRGIRGRDQGGRAQAGEHVVRGGGRRADRGLTALQGLRDHGACNLVSASSSTVRPAASEYSRCRSARRSAPRCTRSAARATSSRQGSSARTTSSTTPMRTSPAAAVATTSCSTTPATGHGARCAACWHRLRRWCSSAARGAAPARAARPHRAHEAGGKLGQRTVTSSSRSRTVTISRCCAT